uniref:Secreted protein n=1 Tax=Oryza glumipatula TaxID=40148 RepID=A0A0E0AA64_9ORYZ
MAMLVVVVVVGLLGVALGAKPNTVDSAKDSGRGQRRRWRGEAIAILQLSTVRWRLEENRGGEDSVHQVIRPPPHEKTKRRKEEGNRSQAEQRKEEDTPLKRMPDCGNSKNNQDNHYNHHLAWD